MWIRTDSSRIWNLVFIQYKVDADLEIVDELPAKNIDAGSSIEHIATLLQGKDDCFETDAFRPLFEVIQVISGRRHAQTSATTSRSGDRRARRTTTFPGRRRHAPWNEGRGYILQQCSSHGRALAPAAIEGRSWSH